MTPKYEYRKLLSFICLSICTFHFLFSQDTLRTIKAEKGDGIHSLLRKQGVNPYTYFDDFIALNIDKLRDSVHLYEGKEYLLPTVKTIKAEKSLNAKKSDVITVSHSIFGDKFSETEIKSRRLAGTIYYLVSGHGGPDPGTVTKYNNVTIAEDEYAYDVTLRLAKELIAHGALVYVIIRDENDGIRDQRILKIDHDEVLYPNKKIPLNNIKRLRQRTALVNSLYAQHSGKYRRLIVTHVDSRSKGENIDVFFYHHKKSKSGKRLAENIHKTFTQKYKKYQPNRAYTGTLTDRNLHMVKYTHPPMTYIEIGNIRNKKDQKRILYPVNRQALAAWIAQGVIADFEGR